LIPTLFLAREEAIIQNAIALNLSYAVSSKFNVSGWVGYEWADSQSSSAEFERSTWALNFGFPDLFQKGNYGGVSIGVFPYVTQETGRFLEEQDPPLVAQVFYGFRVSDNITIQPGLFLIDNPTGDSEKETILIGSVRVKFVF
jgi:Carbohydrate-selective porin, OprB family